MQRAARITSPYVRVGWDRGAREPKHVQPSNSFRAALKTKDTSLLVNCLCSTKPTRVKRHNTVRSLVSRAQGGQGRSSLSIFFAQPTEYDNKSIEFGKIWSIFPLTHRLAMPSTISPLHWRKLFCELHPHPGRNPGEKMIGYLYALSRVRPTASLLAAINIPLGRWGTSRHVRFSLLVYHTQVLEHAVDLRRSRPGDVISIPYEVTVGHG